MAWRWAAASAVGTSHIRSGNRLQDAYAVSMLNRDHILAVVSDGAGSAKFGAYGAWIVCRFLKVRFRDWFTETQVLPDDETVMVWTDELRDRISTIAKERGSTQRQFAATLAFLLISPTEILALNIGDSAIVGREDSNWEVICWPENGEYASTTFFVTDEPKLRLNIVRQKLNYDAFALFSDGINDIALSHLEQRAYTNFFDPMMRPIDKSSGTNRLCDLSQILYRFLESPRVCEKTDDDKTLILLSGS